MKRGSHTFRTVIATGMVALVDDSIVRKLTERRKNLSIKPLSRTSSMRLDLEFVGPRRFIDEVLRRTRPHLRPHSSMPVR